jgi:leader peptidase (prepilin peptidase)/N-methyltransferase
MSSVASSQSFSPAEIWRSAHPAQLAVTAVLVALAVVSFGIHPGLTTAVWLSVVTPSLVLIDLRVQRLPNVLVVPGLGTVTIDLCWSWIQRQEAPMPALATTIVVIAAMLGMNLVGGLGMGDVKLAGVIAGCLSGLSPWLAVIALVMAFFVGGGVAAVLMFRHRGGRGRRIPFGPFLLVGFWMATLLIALSRLG